MGLILICDASNVWKVNTCAAFPLRIKSFQRYAPSVNKNVTAQCAKCMLVAAGYTITMAKAIAINVHDHLHYHRREH